MNRRGDAARRGVAAVGRARRRARRDAGDDALADGRGRPRDRRPADRPRLAARPRLRPPAADAHAAGLERGAVRRLLPRRRRRRRRLLRARRRVARHVEGRHRLLLRARHARMVPARPRLLGLPLLGDVGRRRDVLRLDPLADVGGGRRVAPRRPLLRVLPVPVHRRRRGRQGPPRRGADLREPVLAGRLRGEGFRLPVADRRGKIVSRWRPPAPSP
jgi:hypothetical protein